MANPIEWHEAISKVTPFIVRIATPQTSGSGFLVAHSEDAAICGIATAAHVVNHAHDWDEPIKIEHYQSRQSIVVKPDRRFVFIDQQLDTAAILFNKETLPLPQNPPKLMEDGKVLKTGVEVGWLGFPGMFPQNLCYFSGRVSSFLHAESAYLVDGVSIHGVSGGPAFWLAYDDTEFVGVVSSYVANRATGETLPGLAVVRDVVHLQNFVKRLRSLDDARKQAETEQPKPAEHDAKQ